MECLDRLTTYFDTGDKDWLETTSDWCLTPADRVSASSYDIFYTALAIVLLPITLLGYALRALSQSHAINFDALSAVPNQEIAIELEEEEEEEALFETVLDEVQELCKEPSFSIHCDYRFHDFEANCSTKSHNFDLDREEPLNCTVTFINGILNSPRVAKDHALYLSELMGRLNVHVTYNATHGLFKDLKECHLNLKGYTTQPATLLANQWLKLHSQYPEKQILHFCFSQGTIHTYNALTLPAVLSVRKHLTIVAVCPAKFIPEELAHKVYNLTSSKGDFVQLFQKFYKNKSPFSPTSHIRKKSRSPFDHEFRSEAFKETFQTIIDDYL